VSKNHSMTRAATFYQLMPILAYIGTRRCDIFHWNEKVQKALKNNFWTYWSELGPSVSRNHSVTRVAKFCQLMPILAYIRTCGCAVFSRNEKVQKAPKHDFRTYWSLLGASVSKIHSVIRATNFCHLMPILAYISIRGCDVFYRNENVQKAPKHVFGHTCRELGVSVSKNHSVNRAANFCKLMPILAYVGTCGCDVFHRNEKVQKAPKQDFWTYWSILGECHTLRFFSQA